jgi:predicted nucleic acid-binding protein
MKVFMDTSAVLAILDADDTNHASAAKTWVQLVSSEDRLISTSYVLLETIALVQRRLGITSVKAFDEGVYPLLLIEWIDDSAHRNGMSALLTAGRRRLSLIDCTSFEIARRLQIDAVFAFDQHFVGQGFELAQSRF